MLLRKNAAVGVVVLGALTVGAWVIRRSGDERDDVYAPSAKGVTVAAEEPRAEMPASPQSTVSPLGPSSAAPVSSSLPENKLVAEGHFMTELRALRPLDPAAALLKVRTGDQLFPGGPGAAERGWIAARSLTELGRHDAARAEARRLLAQHPNTHWANDAERHLLIYPPNQPSREEMQRAGRGP